MTKQEKAKLYVNPKPIAIEDGAKFDIDINKGLSDNQVATRRNEGLVNLDARKKGKSILQILLSNVFTYFNLVYMILSAILIIFQQYKQLMFLGVVLLNTAIAIIQEIKSKRSLDKLKFISIPHATVMRNGVKQKVTIEQVALTDIIYFSNGSQICADCIVIEGGVEVNESILTGESESVQKNKGDKIFAGSYVVSNNCTAIVVAVGKYNFINTLAGKARQYKKPKSQLNKSFKIILYVVSVLIPILAFVIYNINFRAIGFGDMPTFINKTVSPIINIIPAGPFLLTSVALAVSVIRLTQHKTMVQELYCIEMLARVDTLCLDKTGTLTDGTMRVIESIDLRTDGKLMVKDIISTMNSAFNESNMTAQGLKAFYGDKKHPMLKSSVVLPFSSKRKFSAISFEREGTYFLGAPEFILKTKNQRIDDMVDKYAGQGYRVLLLAHSTSMMLSNADLSQLPLLRRPVALIVIEDHIRSDAEQTLNWFRDLGVDIKLISGDNPITVSNIAKRLGIVGGENAVSLENFTDEEVKDCATKFSVFGRVSPEQKAILVTALKANGRTVAMTGDGVNDILALKEADCSIAMASGSDAAYNVSHLVLLDNNFANLPQVVLEGRRVVNNIQNASSMFFMKTVFSTALMVFLAILGFGFGIYYAYPFSTTQIILIDTFIVGLPTVFLALQPNKNIIKGNFLTNIFRRAIPASITFFVSFIVLFVFNFVYKLPVKVEHFQTVCALCFVLCSYYALVYACKPYKFWKILLLIVVIFVIFIGATVFREFLDYALLSREEVLLLLTVSMASFPVYAFVYALFNGFKPKFELGLKV
ncbi:MAG: HAD-IC family P-type ATPase [Clostridia bacterium]